MGSQCRRSLMSAEIGSNWQPVKPFQDWLGMSFPSWSDSCQSIMRILQPWQVDRLSAAVRVRCCSTPIWNWRYHRIHWLWLSLFSSAWCRCPGCRIIWSTHARGCGCRYHLMFCLPWRSGGSCQNRLHPIVLQDMLVEVIYICRTSCCLLLPVG